MTTGSFSVAARRLGVATSVVSKRVQALEARLAVTLLHRTTRRLAPTDAGRLLFEQVREVPELVADAEERVRAAGRRAQGVLRVSMPTYFASAGLQHEVVPAFLAANPEVTLDFTIVADPTVHLGQDFDVIVAGKLPQQRFPDTTMVARHLSRYHGALYAAPAYLDLRGRPAHPADLAEHNCLSYPNRDWHFVDPASGDPLVVRTSGTLTTNSNAILWAATMRGLGIAFSFPYFFDDEVRSGQLERVLEPFTSGSYVDIHVFHRGSRFVPPRVRAFIDALVRYFAGRER